MTDTGPELPDTTKANRLRDIIDRIALKVVKRERPEYNFAEVAMASPDGIASVRFTGEEQVHPVHSTGSMASIPGQIVKLDGVPGDRHIVGVQNDPGLYLPEVFFGPAEFSGISATTAPIFRRWGNVLCWEMNPTTTQVLSATLFIPEWWEEYRIDMLWGGFDAVSARACYWRFQFFNLTPEVNVDPADSTAMIELDYVLPVGDDAIIQRTVLMEGVEMKGRQSVAVSRLGNDVLDVSPSDTNFVGLIAVRTR